MSVVETYMEFSPEQPADVDTSTLDMEVHICLDSTCEIWIVIIYYDVHSMLALCFKNMDSSTKSFYG